MFVCSNNNYLQQELKHLQHEFHTQIGYTMWIIKQIMKETKENKMTLVTTQIGIPPQNTNNDRNIHSFMLLFTWINEQIYKTHCTQRY